MKQRIYTVLVENFKRWGITHVFGIPGKSISPLMLELENREIEYVLGRHENGCGYEASGYALGRRSIGIVIGTSGPGGTNLLTSSAQAMEFHLPVLFITGHPSATQTGRALSQESSVFGIDLVKMFEPVTKFSARVDRAEMLPLFLQHAIEKAMTGEKGPVHLCIPFDVLMDEIEPFTIPLPTIAPMLSSGLERVAQLLDKSERPVLFIGKGVIMEEACEELQIIAEHWRIPVITAPGGKGAFSTYHPLNLGGFGLGGQKATVEYMESGIDLMFVIGSQLCDMALSGFNGKMYPKQVIQFEQELKFAGKSIPVPTEIILGDLKGNLNQLIQISSAVKRDEYQKVTPPSQNLEKREGKVISAKQAMKSLRKALPHDTVLFGDAGSHSFYAVQHFDIVESGTFYLDEVFISMGAAIGYSVGYQLACPDRCVVCITGDGCMMLHGTELSTAANYQIPVIFFVLNNGRLDMVDKGMSYNTGRSVGAIYNKPLDTAKFAQSMGVTAFCCRTEEEIAEALSHALNANTPTVVEVLVDPEEVPPILTRLLSLEE